jgi:XTP/dITP diphosphohydrolase
MRRFTGTELLVATHNQGKLEEIAHLLEPFGISVSSAKDHGLPEPEETGTTFVENARIKAHAAAKATGLPALSDDSGIEIDALGGAPGCLYRRLGRNAERAGLRHGDATRP